MKVLLKVICILSDFEATIWAYCAVCMSSSDMPINILFPNLWLSQHWLILSRSTVWLNAKTHQTRLWVSNGCVRLPLYFTITLTRTYSVGWNMTRLAWCGLIKTINNVQEFNSKFYNTHCHCLTQVASGIFGAVKCIKHPI